MAFSSTIPPLQITLSCACSVASLSHSPNFQLPSWRGLHHNRLAPYMIGWSKNTNMHNMTGVPSQCFILGPEARRIVSVCRPFENLRIPHTHPNFSIHAYARRCGTSEYAHQHYAQTFTHQWRIAGWANGIWPDMFCFLFFIPP